MSDSAADSSSRSTAGTPRREGAVAQPTNPRFLKPQLRPAETRGLGAPAGSLRATPHPAPLPRKGSGFIFTVNLIAASIALIFTIMLALKL